MTAAANQPAAAGIRAFIALSIPTHGRQALLTNQKTVKRLVDRGSVRWVDEHGFHLTLFFLGDGIQPAQVAALCDVVDQLASETKPFELALGPLGCFPSARRPTVLWTGITGDLDALQQLKSRTDHLVSKLGWEPETRPFHPHLTLGRVKDQMGVVNSALPYEETLATADWTVNAVHLYHSQSIKNRGPVYTKIHTAKLTP